MEKKKLGVPTEIDGEAVVTHITLDEIERRYHEYNALYFDGRLPSKVKFYKLPIDGYNGKMDYKWGQVPRIGVKYGNGIYWNETRLRNLIVHEMIHLNDEIRFGVACINHYSIPFLPHMLWMRWKHGIDTSLGTATSPVIKKKPHKDDTTLWGKLLMLPLACALWVLHPIYCLIRVPLYVAERKLAGR